MKGLSIIACALAAGVATTAAAQSAPKTPAPRTVTPDDSCSTTEDGRVECRKVIERDFGPRLDSIMMKRAALGLSLAPTGTARDTLGVFVTSVTPKGPAENAGIIEGDRIVSINGVDLRVSRADIDDPYASGIASHRLPREVAKLSPGSRVNLRVYSGGRTRDVQVTAARATDLMRTRTMIGGFGGGPFIYGDGMVMPSMPPMVRMSPMPDMQGMRIRELAPGLDRMRIEMMPEMRRLRDLPEMRNMRDFELLEPGRVYRLRRPDDAPARARRTKVEAERVKAKADSVRKNK